MTAREFEVASVVVLGSALAVLLVKEHMLAPGPAPAPGGTPPPTGTGNCTGNSKLGIPCRQSSPSGTTAGSTGGVPDPRSVSF